MGFSRQEYWNGLPSPPPGDLPNLGIKPTSLMSNLHWQVDSLLLAPPGKARSYHAAAAAAAKSLQSCPTLCDPMDCNPPGSSVHGILHARILEWVAKPSSRGSSQPRDHISSVSCIGKWVPLLPPGKPLDHTIQLKILSIPLLSYISHTSLCR